MSEQATATGGCLCGAVRFRATLPETTLTACHCNQCQRWTGGGPLYSIRVRDLQLEGEDAITAYHASGYGERAFCSICGTTLYWRMQGQPIAFLTPALFDDQSNFRVGEEIFVDHRAAWQPPYEGATQSTEAEQQQLLADYLAKEGGRA